MSTEGMGSYVEPLDNEYCPHCGQLRPTGFATGTRSLSPDTSVRYADGPLDPDGPEGYEVITRLARGDEAEDIATSMALTLGQVTGLKPYIGRARNVKRGVRV